MRSMCSSIDEHLLPSGRPGSRRAASLTVAGCSGRNATVLGGAPYREGGAPPASSGGRSAHGVTLPRPAEAGLPPPHPGRGRAFPRGVAKAPTETTRPRSTSLGGGSGVGARGRAQYAAQCASVSRPVWTSFPTTRRYTYVPAARPDASNVARCVPASWRASTRTATSRPSTSYTARRTSEAAATSYEIVVWRANGFGATATPLSVVVADAAAKKSPSTAASHSVSDAPAPIRGADTVTVKLAVSQMSSAPKSPMLRSTA